MTTTSLCLGDHREVLIKNEIAHGRYGSASEVVLRHIEGKSSKLTALRAHLAEGEAQALAGDFIKDYAVENLLVELTNE